MAPMTPQRADAASRSPASRIRRNGVLYAEAVAVLAVALLLRYLLDPWIGNGVPYITVSGAVAAIVAFAGAAPAGAAAGAGYPIANYLFVEPRGQFGVAQAADVAGLLAYGTTCLLIIGFGEASRRAHVRATRRGEVLRLTLRSIGDAVITTDVARRVTSMNPVAEALSGWSQPEGRGRSVDEVFSIVNEFTREPVLNPVTQALREGRPVSLANDTVLIGKGGGE